MPVRLYLSMFKIRATAGPSVAPQALPPPSILHCPHFSNLITSLQPPPLVLLLIFFGLVLHGRPGCFILFLSFLCSCRGGPVRCEDSAKRWREQSQHNFRCCFKIKNRCRKALKSKTMGSFIKSTYNVSIHIWKACETKLE